MLLPQRYYLYLVIIPITLFAGWYILPPLPVRAPYYPSYSDLSEASDVGRIIDAAGNETLGFEAIITLSTGPSWRTRGLLAAANLTGLQIRIPPQPPLHPEMINVFENLGPADIQHPSRGAAAAWLAHLDIIKFSIQSDFDTVLIIEDDVDWDVAIRDQMKLVANAVRNLTNTPASEKAPYGRDWDVLWIGHCGEYWEDSYETVIFQDPTVCPHSKYLGWAKQYIERLPDYHRAVYRSFNPVCSFAYALSKEGARKVLQYMGASQGEAFDVKMMETCKAHQLSCISVVPEVIHQYFPPPKYEVKSAVDILNGEKSGSVEEEFEGSMGSTENILESARCHALFGQSCLKEG